MSNLLKHVFRICALLLLAAIAAGFIVSIQPAFAEQVPAKGKVYDSLNALEADLICSVTTSGVHIRKFAADTGLFAIARLPYGCRVQEVRLGDGYTLMTWWDKETQVLKAVK